MDTPAQIPGWYGKLPALGDFASRRLPSRFIVPWDDWLQQGLAASRAALGEAWLNVYLTSPLWRFLLMPGVCGNGTWCGVLMPSVDRVGRYFPLTIASEILHFASSDADWRALGSWHEKIEQAALSVLNPSHTPDDLDEALSLQHASFDEMPKPIDAIAEHLLAAFKKDPHGYLRLQLLKDESVAAVLASAGGRMLASNARGVTLWWSQSPDHDQTDLLFCLGLPSASQFVQLLEPPKDPSAIH